MNQYAVLCECPSCHDKSVWYANTDASDMETLQSEIEEAMVRLVVGGYACKKCGERGLDAMAIKEANEDIGEPEYFVPDSFVECGFCNVCGKSGRALNADCLCVMCWRGEK